MLRERKWRNYPKIKKGKYTKLAHYIIALCIHTTIVFPSVWGSSYDTYINKIVLLQKAMCIIRGVNQRAPVNHFLFHFVIDIYMYLSNV